MPQGSKRKPIVRPHDSANPSLIDIAQQIAEVRGVMITEFDAIKDHLATLNGRVGKHDDLFAKILGKEKFQDGTRNGISITSKVLLAVATIVLAVLAIIFGPHK